MSDGTHNTGDGVDAVASDFAHLEEGGAALDQSKDELVREFRKLIGDGEALLKASASLSGESSCRRASTSATGSPEAKSSIDALSTAARRAAVAPPGDERLRARDSLARRRHRGGIGFVIGAMVSRR